MFRNPECPAEELCRAFEGVDDLAVVPDHVHGAVGVEDDAHIGSQHAGLLLLVVHGDAVLAAFILDVETVGGAPELEGVGLAQAKIRASPLVRMDSTAFLMVLSENSANCSPLMKVSSQVP